VVDCSSCSRGGGGGWAAPVGKVVSPRKKKLKKKLCIWGVGGREIQRRGAADNAKLGDEIIGDL